MSAEPRSRPWDEVLDPPLEWLERANRHALVTRLVAATVHDVSNALQVVSGAAEMLGLDLGPEAIARRSASIVHQAMAATAGLQQLTAFAREMPRPAERLRLREYCERALAARQYALRKGRIASRVDGDDGTCDAPARMVSQVLLNLLLNAEQALVDRPEPTLTLTVATGDAGVTLRVRDNGPGMTEGERERAFRWPPPAAPEPGPLGIGLIVSRALVERAGGTLRIEAAPDGGTVAVLRLVAGTGS
jgi:two-component system C4-dicarboxylate transport sensor histidine kinase DctB